MLNYTEYLANFHRKFQVRLTHVRVMEGQITKRLGKIEPGHLFVHMWGPSEMPINTLLGVGQNLPYSSTLF